MGKDDYLYKRKKSKIMSMIKFEDEADLQRKICKILNKYGYHFEKTKSSAFCDIIDPIINAYGEVKTHGKFAPQQLLYGLAREGIKNAQYLILANEFELRVYKPPSFDKIMEFAKSIDPDLKQSPSEITSVKAKNEAFDLLGEHTLAYNYVGEFKIDEKQPYIFLDETNYEYFQYILSKYRIDPAKFIRTFADTWVKGSSLNISKVDDRTIIDINLNKSVKAGKRIIDKFDRVLIENTRIDPSKVGEILHKIDTLAPIDIRRKRGKYWSSANVSEIVTEYIREYVKPTFIFEPFVGGGSLIRDLVEECSGVVNDIDESMVGILEKEWEGLDWKFHSKDFFKTPINEIASWIPDLSDDDVFCIYTNPPFGSTHGSKLTSKKDEIKGKSRKTEIVYGTNKNEAKYIGDTYGRGDLILPSIGRMIEIVKMKGKGYLAFFSPFGVMLGRKRYVKLLKALLKDFEFIYGEVFSGKMFNGVAKNVSISFTIWKYNRNCNTDPNTLSFWYNEKEYRTKILPLLKDGWKYRDGDKYVKDKTHLGIYVPNNAMFNSPVSKFYHNTPTEGGNARMSIENVKIPLNIPNIPDELIYGLWSITVGKSSATKYPVLFNDAYVHLPDFKNEKVIEILPYSLMYGLLREIAGNYTDGRIGFVGMRRVFKFGGKRLTDGAKYLIESYRHLPIGDTLTIGEVFDRLKNGEEPEEIDPKLRILIKGEIQKRLEAIGYWDYLPIPDIYADSKKKKSAKL